MSESPTITFINDFRRASTNFVGYVDYTNRKNAVTLEELSGDVQADFSNSLNQAVVKVKQERTNGYVRKRDMEVTTMFNADYDNAPRKELRDTKKKLRLAQENGSLLWRTVISFDNEFLEKQGLYDSETKLVDQKAIKDVIRQAMPGLIKREGLSDDAFWWGNIHINTGNIHVHLGISEIHSARPKKYYPELQREGYKGQFSQKTIKAFKSFVYNNLVNTIEREKILKQEINLKELRKKLLAKGDNPSKKGRMNDFLLQQVYNHLPESKWRYKSNAKNMRVAKWYLDKYIDYYFEHEGKKDYQEFREETASYLNHYRQAYSKEDNFNFDKALEQREQELRERLGQKILNYLKENLDDSLKPNLDKFSVTNVAKVTEILPDATVIHTEKQWQQLGYVVNDGADTLPVLIPDKQKDLSEDKVGQNYKEVSYYDISQVSALSNNKNQSGVRTYQALMLSGEELENLINVVQETGQNDQATKQELAIYRYTLRLKNLKQRRNEVVAKQQDLSSYAPLTTDSHLYEFTQNKYKEEIELLDLQTQPKFKQTIADKERLTELQERHANVVKIPIQKVDQHLAEVRLANLQEEKQALLENDNKELQQLIYGENYDREGYLIKLDQQMRVLELKQDIHERNEELGITDSQSKRAVHLRKKNGEAFNELRNLYEDLKSTSTMQSAGEKKQNDYEEDTTMVNPKEAQYNKNGNVLGSTSRKSTPKIISPHATQGVHLMLKNNGRKEMQALLKKWRTDDRDEQQRRFEEEQERETTV